MVTTIKAPADAPADKTRTATTIEETAAPAARTVRYVVNRPYSAGELPDIVTARVAGQSGDDPNLLDLVVGDTEIKSVRRSDRQEPGTWFEEGR